MFLVDATLIIIIVTFLYTVSYPFNKGKISALNTLQAGDFPGLYQVLGKEDATHSDLMETGQRFFTALYGQALGTMMSEARYRILKEEGKAYAHHGITSHISEPIYPCSQSTSSNDAVEGS